MMVTNETTLAELGAVMADAGVDRYTSGVAFGDWHVTFHRPTGLPRLSTVGGSGATLADAIVDALEELERVRCRLAAEDDR